MFSKSILGVALALALPIVANAQTTDDLKLFNDLCLATNAKGADVVAKAHAQGFVRPPPGLAKELAGASFPNAIMNWRLVDEGFLMVLTADGAVPFDDEVGGDICAIMVVPEDQKASTKVRDLLGVAKAETTKDGLDLFIYQEQDGKRRAVSSQAMLSMMHSLESGRLRMVMTGNTDFAGNQRVSMIMLVVPRPKQVSLLDR